MLIFFLQQSDVQAAYDELETYQQTVIDCLQDSIESLHDRYNTINLTAFAEAEKIYSNKFSKLAKTLAYRMNYQVLLKNNL